MDQAENLTKGDNEVFENQQQTNVSVPKYRLDVTKIIDKILIPGRHTTAEQSEVIQHLWKVWKNYTPENIAKADEAINNLDNSDVKRIMLEEWNHFIEANKEPEVQNQQQTMISEPQYPLNVSEIINRMKKPGSYTTEEETKVIENLWNVTNNYTPEKIAEIDKLINGLANTDNKTIISEEWNHFIEANKKEEVQNTYNPELSAILSDIEEFSKRQTDILKSELESLELTNQAQITEKEKYESELEGKLNQDFKKYLDKLEKQISQGDLNNKDIKDVLSIYANISRECRNMETIISNFDNGEEYSPEKLIESQKKILEGLQEILSIAENSKLLTDEEKATLRGIYDIEKISSFISENNYNTGILESQLKKQASVGSIQDEMQQVLTGSYTEDNAYSKLYQLVSPIYDYYDTEIDKINSEMRNLAQKMSNKDNYISPAHFDELTARKELLEEQISEEDRSIKQLEEQNKRADTYISKKEEVSNTLNHHLEEMEIILDWKKEAGNQGEIQQEILANLYEEVVHNINHCNFHLDGIMKAEKDKEYITEKLAASYAQKRELISRKDEIDKKLANHSQKANDVNSYVADITKQKELEKRHNELSAQKKELDDLLNKFKDTYSKDKSNEKKEEPLQLPGVLEDGTKLNSDGNIYPTLPGVLEDGTKLNSDGSMIHTLPGVLEDGTKLSSDGSYTTPREKKDANLNNKLSNDDSDEIEKFTPASQELIEKSNKLKDSVTKVWEFIKKHAKKFIIGGVVVTLAMVGAFLYGKSKETDEEEQKEAPVVAEQIADNIVEEPTPDDTNSNDDIEEDYDFDKKYDEAIANALGGDYNVYENSYNAINETNPLDHDTLYVPSWETSKMAQPFTVNDKGGLDRITKDEARELTEAGENIAVRVENEDTGIGFVTIPGAETVAKSR